MITIATLATNRPVYRPLTTSGCCTNSIGPGMRPCIRKPPSSTADEFELGNAEAQHRHERRARDRVVRGLRRRDAFRRSVAELLLVPRPAPRLVVGEETEDIAPPPPGIIPSNVPITDPIACGSAMRRHIARLGNLIRALSRVAFSQPGSPLCTNSSLMAYRPTITRIGGMPDSSSGLSNVKRLSPVTGSVPTVAIIRPSDAGHQALQQRFARRATR